MQDVVSYILNLTYVVLPAYLFIQVMIWLIRIVYLNQSMIVSFPLP